MAEHLHIINCRKSKLLLQLVWNPMPLLSFNSECFKTLGFLSIVYAMLKKTVESSCNDLQVHDCND